MYLFSYCIQEYKLTNHQFINFFYAVKLFLSILCDLEIQQKNFFHIILKFKNVENDHKNMI